MPRHKVFSITMHVKERHGHHTYGRLRLTGPGRVCEFSALRSIKPYHTRTLQLQVPFVSIRKGEYQLDLLVFQAPDAVGQVVRTILVALPLEGEYELEASTS